MVEDNTKLVLTVASSQGMNTIPTHVLSTAHNCNYWLLWFRDASLYRENCNWYRGSPAVIIGSYTDVFPVTILNTIRRMIKSSGKYHSNLNAGCANKQHRQPRTPPSLRIGALVTVRRTPRPYYRWCHQASKRQCLLSVISCLPVSLHGYTYITQDVLNFFRTPYFKAD